MPGDETQERRRRSDLMRRVDGALSENSGEDTTAQDFRYCACHALCFPGRIRWIWRLRL